MTLEEKAARLRVDIIEMLYRAQSGHPGGSLSCIDALVALYYNVMNVDPAKPGWEDRDRFVLSKGHCCPALYAVLADKGFFPREELWTLRQLGSHLQGHPDMRKTPGVDANTGSLGQGISAAVGMALAGKLDSKDYRVYAVLGDGEIQEGQVWEAAMAAGNFGLDNLCAIVDNNIQIDGTIEEIMSPYPIDRKFEDFGWNVVHCDGHDAADIAKAFDAARACKGKPTMVIAHTVKGKGVSFMENSAEWHGNDPNTEQYLRAAAELDALVMNAEKEVSAHA